MTIYGKEENRKRAARWVTIVCALLGLAGCSESDATPHLDAGEPTGSVTERDGAAVAVSDAARLDDAAGARADGGTQRPEIVERACTTAAGADFAKSLGCRADFDALASIPVDADIPGARSVKVVLDQLDGDALYFQNSQKYQIHHQFVAAHLSGQGKPPVPMLAAFASEYRAADRRFILGAVTYYEDPKLWVFELAPYDLADAALIEKIMKALQAQTYFGPALGFHPTSIKQAGHAEELGAAIPVVTTDDIYAGTTYQPLTLAKAMGRLQFMKAADLATEYVPYRNIVVLDEVPNDISVVSGLITQEFQTPLSHVNVLSNNRNTPNMGLRNATTDPKLRALEGKWVELDVRATIWTIREVTMEEADAYWEAHKPAPVVLPAIDLTVTGLHDIETIVDETQGTLREAIKRSVLAYGGKSAQYAVLKGTPGLPVRKAFAIPIYYYDQFMKENGFYARIDALLADPSFKDSPEVRDAELKKLRDDMGAAPVNEAFQQLLRAKLEADYPGLGMRFRTSTNSEDLDGFPCAGCYESHTGDAGNWDDVLDAVRDTWATVWLFRTFEERSYYGIEHTSVGMGLLVHHNFPDEEANGVALTANPFDPMGLDEPAYYVNVQWGGEAEVVHPPPGITSDEFLYYAQSPGQPTTFLTESNLLPRGMRVLTARQTYDLGSALKLIHDRFSAAYGPKAGNNGWYAMDVEFKFDDEEAAGGPATLYIKQARPHPGRGVAVETD